MEISRYILALNCGSSSLKFGLFNAQSLEQTLSGKVASKGLVGWDFKINGRDGEVLVNYPIAGQDSYAAVDEVINWFQSNKQLYPLAAIGHRMVQGGPDHRKPELIGEALLKSLDQQVYLAPNHLPTEIAVVKTVIKSFPGIPQVACFDTFFHAGLPPCAKYYALPNEYRAQGLIRYGFHGLSYEYIMKSLWRINASLSRKKIIIAHLGNGASMVAVKNGVSIDTTMGISPVGGLVMSTRSGDIDPGVALFLLKQNKLSVEQLDDLLSKQSGLKAIAGTGDMEILLKDEHTDAKAREAVTAFCYQAKKQIGALAAAMGGLDALVFTGGIGENSSIIRKYICHGLDFLGISINKVANEDGHQVISEVEGKVKVCVLATNEERMIATHSQTFIKEQNIHQHHHER